MFDSSQPANWVGRQSTFPLVSDNDKCVMVVCSAIKVGPCKHGRVTHYSKVKTVILVEDLGTVVVYHTGGPLQLHCWPDALCVSLQGCEYVVGLVHFMKLAWNLSEFSTSTTFIAQLRQERVFLCVFLIITSQVCVHLPIFFLIILFLLNAFEDSNKLK